MTHDQDLDRIDTQRWRTGAEQTELPRWSTIAGRSSTLDFLPDPSPLLLAEYLVAFANTDGGAVVIGQDAEGLPTGPVRAEDIEPMLQAAERLCRPPLSARCERIETADGLVFTLSVPRSPELHTLADGRVLIRSGTEIHTLTGDQIRLLAATKSSGDFEAEVLPATGLDDLDSSVLTDFLARRAERRPAQQPDPGRTQSRPPEEVLADLGALDPSGRVTVAGALLFGRRPQAALPQAGLVFVRFLSSEPRGPDGLAGYSRREEIDGPLPRLIERTWQILREEIPVGAVIRDLEREERPAFPAFAVREALVNAVCHRDYRLRGRRIEVRLYSDRLEVISPGGLPGFITLDNIVEDHYSRNPRIVATLFQWGYIEELGLGIDRMIEDMVQAGNPPPRFKATPYSFTVILERAAEPAPPKRTPAWTQRMNERQARAVAYVQEHGSITNREYHDLCPDVSAETLRLDLVDLVDKGVLLKIGSKKGTYYILK